MVDIPPQRPVSRPLSPHLQVYRWGWHMAVSIVHRVTGVALATAGVVLTLWWLGAAASGPEAYARFHSVISSLLGRLVLLGLTFTVFQHMMSGLRHLYLDTGRGYDLAENRRLSIACFLGSVLLTLAVWGLSFSGAV